MIVMVMMMPAITNNKKQGKKKKKKSSKFLSLLFIPLSLSLSSSAIASLHESSATKNLINIYFIINGGTREVWLLGCP